MGKKLTSQELVARVKALEKELNNLREFEKKWRDSEERLQKANKRLLQYRKRLKSAQQNTIQNERLKVFYQIASFVIHDLRRSISFLSLFAENLVKRFGGDPFLKESSEAIANEIKRVRELIDTISNLPHDFQPEFQKCDVNHLLIGVVNTFQSFPNVKVISNLSNLPLVDGDFRNLQTVFYNVIKNSFEAMPDSGELLVSTDIIRGNRLRRKWGDFIRVNITDTGYGISSEFLKNGLFEPFYTTKEKGLGIGLYQSKEIVKRHKGKIEIRSKQNKGTTCTITLPISQS